jgi:cell division protein FtsQ
MMHQLIDKRRKTILYLMLFFTLSTTNNINLENQKNYSTTTNKINITGIPSDSNFQLLNKLENINYKNIFNIKKEEINKIISEYNIIEEYNIKKIYPSSLNIDIKQTKIIAKISGNNQLLVGANGKLIMTIKTDKTLPYIFGEFNSNEFIDFKKHIDNSKFKFTDIKSIFFFPSNRWDILTNNDVLIKLPKTNLSKSLLFAHKIITNNEFIDHKLIDLRVTNHLVVK